MPDLVPLVQAQVLIGLVCALVILFMQACAYREHRRKFFATLATSTVLAIAATAMAASPYFLPLTGKQAVAIYRLSVPLGVLATLLATVASVQLFRPFDDK